MKSILGQYDKPQFTQENTKEQKINLFTIIKL